jgi:hypothetical protein
VLTNNTTLPTGNNIIADNIMLTTLYLIADTKIIANNTSVLAGNNTIDGITVHAGNTIVGLADNTRLGLAYCPWLTVHDPNLNSPTCVLLLPDLCIGLGPADN